MDLSTLNRYSLAHFIVMGIDDKDKDPRHLTDKYMGDDVRSISEYFESSSDSEDEAEEKEEGVRFASPRLSRMWCSRMYNHRITHDQNTLEHRYKNKGTADSDTTADSGDDDARGFEFTTGEKRYHHIVFENTMYSGTSSRKRCDTCVSILSYRVMVRGVRARSARISLSLLMTRTTYIIQNDHSCHLHNSERFTHIPYSK